MTYCISAHAEVNCALGGAPKACTCRPICSKISSIDIKHRALPGMSRELVTDPRVRDDRVEHAEGKRVDCFRRSRTGVGLFNSARHSDGGRSLEQT